MSSGLNHSPALPSWFIELISTVSLASQVGSHCCKSPPKWAALQMGEEATVLGSQERFNFNLALSCPGQGLGLIAWEGGFETNLLIRRAANRFVPVLMTWKLYQTTRHESVWRSND